MRKQTTSKWLILGLLLSIFSLKSQTCTSPVIIPVNQGFIGVDSFVNSSTRFLRFTANNDITKIKLFIKNYNPSNNVVNIYNNECTNLAANKLTGVALEPRMDQFPLNVSGDSIEVFTQGFLNGNQYLIELGVSPTNTLTYTKYNISITTSSITAGCFGSNPCSSPTCELVCNGGFEGLSSGVNGFGQIAKAFGWMTATPGINGGTPDLYSNTANSPFPECGVPCNFDGTRANITTTCTSKNNYAVILNTYVPPAAVWPNPPYQYSEYIETQLSAPMVAGQSYIISMYVSKAQNGNSQLNKLSYWLTSSNISVTSWNQPLPNATYPPSGTLSNSTILNASGWTKVTFCYVANGGEQFLTIGMPDDPGAFSVGTNSAVNVPYCSSMWSQFPGWQQSNNHALYIDEVSVVAFEYNAGLTQTVSPCGIVNLNATAATCGTTSLGSMNYNWSGPGVNTNSLSATATVTSSSTFFFYASGNASDGSMCYDFSNMSVISNTPTPLLLTPSSSSICPGSTVSITASGATSYTFQPGNITTNPAVFSPTTTTTYTVTGLTASGCYMTTTITINTYTNTLSINSATNNICIGSAVTLTASGGNTYTWSPGGQTTSTVSVSPGSTTTYTVTGLTNPNNCLKSTTKTITVYSLPTITVSPSATNTICLNSSITLTASGASTYTWQAGNIVSPTVILSPTTTTNYTVTGTSSQGCNNNRTVSITVNPLPSISCVTNKTLVCQGSTSTLSATGASTYTWSPVGLTGASVVVTSTANPTNYTVTGTSSLGCTNTCVVTQNVFTSGTSFFSVTATPTAICNSPAGTSTLTASGSPNNYTWSPSGQVGSSITSTVAGIFTVTSTNSIGCVGSKTVQLHGTDDVAAFNTIPPVCGTQSINLLNYVNPPMGAGTFSVNGTQISGSIYTFTPSAGTYTVGYTYTAGILCSYTATYALTTNTDCCNSTTLTPITSTLITGTSTITGGKSINQNITIASGANLTFDGGEFIIAPNVQINIQGGGSLFIDGAHLYACQNRMWDGINIQYNGRVISRPGSTGMSTFIEDAKNAINIEPINSPPPTFAAPIEIHNTIFNKNYTAININTVNINMDLDIQLQENVFTCRTITFTPSSWPTTSTVTPGLRSASSGTATTGLTAPYPLQSFSYTTCLSPYSGLPSNAGVRLTNVSYSTSYVYGVQIGESNSIDDQTDFNLFDALAYGIYADESNVSVINNVFQNTRQYNTPPPKPKTKGGSAIYYYVNTDYFRQLNLTNTISSYSLTPSVGNRFWDCHMAVEASRVYVFNMQYNTVRSTQSTAGGTGFLAGNTGVLLATNRFAFYIKNNEFSNVRLPINIPISSNTYNNGSGTQTGIYANNLGILYNYFGPQTSTSTAQGNNYIGDAITISSPMSVTWNKQTNTGISVVNNTIDRVYRGLAISGIDSYSTTVKENTVSVVNDALFAAAQHGFKITNTTNNIVVTTNTLSASNNTNTAITLVYAGSNYGTANSPSITCNYLTSGYKGFDFVGSNSVTVWKGNQMQSQARGMSLTSAGRIGTQGGSGAPSGNVWNGSWSGNNGTYVDAASNASLSILYVSAYPPNPGGPIPSSSYANTVNTPTTTGSFSCGGGGGGGGGDGRYTNNPKSSLSNYSFNNSSSTGKMGETENYASEDLKYIANLLRYKYLNMNDSLRINGNGNFSFYNNLANTSIASFVKAENDIYTNQLSSAFAQVAAITPTNNVEANYLKYFDIYKKYSEDDLSESDLTELQSLANLCPGTNGAIVYNARALYNVITKSVITYIENCDDEVSQRTGKSASGSLVSTYTWDVNLYPNPSTGALNIICTNNNDNVNVSIQDVNGKTVLNYHLIIKDFIGKLDLDLANGVYFISISNLQNETITKKLVITK